MYTAGNFVLVAGGFNNAGMSMRRRPYSAVGLSVSARLDRVIHWLGFEPSWRRCAPLTNPRGKNIHMESSPHQTVEERSEFGKALRQQTPRTSHAQWPLESERSDPIGLLEEQNADRLD